LLQPSSYVCRFEILNWSIAPNRVSDGRKHAGGRRERRLPVLHRQVFCSCEGFSLNFGGDWNILPHPNILFASAMKPFEVVARVPASSVGAQSWRQHAHMRSRTRLFRHRRPLPVARRTVIGRTPRAERCLKQAVCGTRARAACAHSIAVHAGAHKCGIEVTCACACLRVRARARAHVHVRAGAQQSCDLAQPLCGPKPADAGAAR